MSIANKQDFVQDKDFLQQYSKLPEKSKVTIRFFDRGDYFSLHGSDALYAAKEFFKTNNAIKIWKGANSTELETCYVKQNNFEALLKELLLVKQYRVEVWKKSNKTNEWSMSNHGSPGNISQFEDILYANEEGSDQANGPLSDPGLISIQITSEDNINKLVCAHIDKISRTFMVCNISFKDNFTDLESLLIGLGPKECLIPSSGGSRDYYNKLIKCLEKNSILVTERKKSEFANDLACVDLNRLVLTSNETNVANTAELSDPNSIGSLNSLIKYLDLLQDSNNEKKFKLKSYNLNAYLKLDSGAFKSLNLLPEARNSSANKTHSVYGLLNKCSTPQGQRLLTQWIKQPLVDIHKIQERQNIVEILVSDTELRSNLVENYLKRFPDFGRIEWKFIKEKAKLQDCYKIYMAVQCLPHMFDSLLKHNGENSYLIRDVFTNPLNSLIMDFSKYQELIESTIDLKQVEKNHTFLINSNFYPELKDLRDKLDEMEDKIEQIANKAGKDLDIQNVKYESNAQSGYFLRVPRKDDAAVRANKSYRVIETRKDGIKITNDKLEKYNEDFYSLNVTYEEQQKGVVDEVIKIASGYLENIQVLNQLIAELDIYVAFAQVAVGSQSEYIRPKLHEMGSGILRIKESRHPCLELQDGISFIPNDCEFKKEEKLLCLITGPNMGGKSTYVRQVAIICLMAQIGSFVPCSEAELSVLDCILARIGASDCQNKGVSTFMAEMLETSFILKTATANSLVIVDELGRGTSTYDGFGLAWAISEFLVKKVKCFTLFATHFHELTALSEEVQTVFNRHVSAITNEEALVLLYKVVDGVCDQSFGIHVAQLANFPKHVLETAKEKAKYLEDYFPLLDNDDQKTEDHNQKYKFKQETNVLIENCFQKIKQVDASCLTDADYVRKIQEIIQLNAKLSNNPYFKTLVDKL